MTKEPTTMHNPNVKVNPINPSKKKKSPYPKKAREKQTPNPDHNKNLREKRQRWRNPHIKNTKDKPSKPH
jgi:hypothetical protein